MNERVSIRRNKKLILITSWNKKKKKSTETRDYMSTRIMRTRLIFRDRVGRRSLSSLVSYFYVGGGASTQKNNKTVLTFREYVTGRVLRLGWDWCKWFWILCSKWIVNCRHIRNWQLNVDSKFKINSKSQQKNKKYPRSRRWRQQPRRIRSVSYRSTHKQWRWRNGYNIGCIEVIKSFDDVLWNYWFVLFWRKRHF
jgi:hypothetical protein